MRHDKALHTTVDFFDDLLWSEKNGMMDDPSRVDALLSLLASIGVCRVDWNWDTWNLLYKFPFCGENNIMAYAAKRAHSMGMELHAVIKPFETGLGVYLPHDFPRPAGVPVIEDISGFMTSVDPFAAANPDMRLKRRPVENPDNFGDIRGIRLVKWDSSPARILPEDLSIWMGSRNGRLERYKGAFAFNETVEWKPVIPMGPTSGHPVERLCRVISIDGISIDKNSHYVFVKCGDKSGRSGFTNRTEHLMEIYDEKGRLIPSTPAWSKVPAPCPRNPGLFRKKYIGYYGSAEVEEFLADSQKADECYSDFYDFRGKTSRMMWDRPVRTFDREGYAGLARGKDEYLRGALSPIYPEVREYWLGIVKECIAAGVDGVDLRAANHSCISWDWHEYGFNDPIIQQGGKMIDREKTHQSNGDAYTGFLKNAKALLAAHGKSMSVHVNATVIYPDARMGPGNLPPNFEWQWERWITEDIADAVSIKDLHMLVEPEADHVIDRIAGISEKYNKPVTYISTNKELGHSSDTGTGTSSRIEWELSRVAEDGRFHAYNLYETGRYIRINENGRLEIYNPDIAELTSKFL